MNRWELFYRNLWLHLRRAPRDLGSLKIILSVLGLFAYLVYLIWSVFYLGIWGSIFTGLMLLLAYAITLLIAKSHRETDRAMLSLAPTRQSIELPESNASHVAGLQKLLLHRAILADRAGTEAMIRIGILPEGTAGAGRRRSIDLAHSSQVWDDMSSEEQGLLLAPEGAWPTGEVDEKFLWAEDVRALRWILRMDAVLAPFEFAKLDLVPVLEITGGKVKPGEACIATWDIRPARYAAQEVLLRGLAEGTLRGIWNVHDQNAREELQRMAKNKGEAPAEDLLTGVDTFAAADDDRVKAVSQLASRRLQVFQEALSILQSPENA